MRGKTADLQRLFLIVKWCIKTKAIVDDVKTYEKFISRENYLLVDGAAFCIGQIGEHARNLSDEMKETIAEIPWRQISNMRNRLFHDYESRDKKIIWKVITEDIPILSERCLEVLRAENSEVDAEIRAELMEETNIFDEERENENR